MVRLGTEPPMAVSGPARPAQQRPKPPDGAISFRAPEAPAVPLGPEPAPAAETRRPIAPARPAVEPLDADLARLHMTVSRRFLAKLQATRDALSHSRPGASAEEALEACMDLLLARHARRRGLVQKPRKDVRPGARPTAWRTIPAAVRREVWRRAGGRCEWPLHEGSACGSTLRLEFAHVTPRARGGPSTTENLRLHCRVHNALAARRDFGDGVVDRYTQAGAGFRALRAPETGGAAQRVAPGPTSRSWALGCTPRSPVAVLRTAWRRPR
jgi:hypothetical protein